MCPSRLVRAASAASLVVAAFTLAALAPHTLPAQIAPGDTGTTAAPVPPWERRSATRLAVGGAGLYQSARGASGTRVQDGGGFDLFGSVAIASFALGVGYQRSQHGLPGAAAGRATDQGAFVEPRFSVAPFRNFTPYVSGRLGFIRRSVPQSARYAAETRSLVSYGAGVGTLVSVAPGVQLDIGALYTRLNGGDQAGAAVVPGPFVGGTGGGALLRAGLVLGLDRWGR